MCVCMIVQVNITTDDSTEQSLGLVEQDMSSTYSDIFTEDVEISDRVINVEFRFVNKINVKISSG